jgi:serine/threonine protein kinase
MFRSGDKIGPYVLIRQIGTGGFGVVWLAEKRTPITTTEFALKLALDQNPNLEAIKQEAKLWKQAGGHPNVLPIIEADVYDDLVVIVSEYAPDGSLEGWMKSSEEGVPPIEESLEMTFGILAGLQHLHSRRVIHRDLKPANILLQGDTPRLADFGIARVLKSTNLSVTIAGTPFYMAPETFSGVRSEQTDLWSVGVILYQLLSGRLPFRQTELFHLIEAIRTREAESLPESVPICVQEFIVRTLNKNPARRYSSAVDMRQALLSARQSLGMLDRRTVRYPPQFDDQPKRTGASQPARVPPGSFDAPREPVSDSLLTGVGTRHWLPISANKPKSGKEVRTDVPINRVLRWITKQQFAVKLLAAILAAGILTILMVVRFWEEPTEVESFEASALNDKAERAESLYEKRLVELRSSAQGLANEIVNRALVSSSDNGERDSASALARLQDIIARAHDELSLDFLIVADSIGRVIARSSDRPSSGETLIGSRYKNPIAEKMIADGSRGAISGPTASCVIERNEEVVRFGLSAGASLNNSPRSNNDEALILEAGTPIFSTGRFLGMLLIGQILNGRPPASEVDSPSSPSLVAEVRQSLYQKENRDAGALIALGDTIISSSVGTSDSGTEQALQGTKRDLTKMGEILKSGDRRYAVAWRPIKSFDGSSVGAIGIAEVISPRSGVLTISRRAAVLVVGGLILLVFGSIAYLRTRILRARKHSTNAALSAKN